MSGCVLNERERPVRPIFKHFDIQKRSPLRLMRTKRSKMVGMIASSTLLKRSVTLLRRCSSDFEEFKLPSLMYVEIVPCNKKTSTRMSTNDFSIAPKQRIIIAFPPRLRPCIRGGFDNDKFRRALIANEIIQDRSGRLILLGEESRSRRRGFRGHRDFETASGVRRCFGPEDVLDEGGLLYSWIWCLRGRIETNELQ